MLFSSSTFIFLFLPASLIGYQILSRFGRLPMLSWLTLVSLFFYGYWNPKYLVLLLISILMNFLFSRQLGEGKSERGQSGWLLTAIIANVGLLMYYKYLFPLLNFMHVHGALHHQFANVILPLGISFFTFTQIAYLIDVRQGIAKRQSIIPYSVFVTFFPHLIAGPIIHPRELMPQLEEGRIGPLKADDLAVGVSWFVMGLAKKVLIADRIAPLADVLYAHPHAAGFATTWLGALAYVMQLYFDFSGYSDMAVALARMFSLDFPINFNSPYKAQCVIEFWQGWHMTLSRYLNEYLYTPIRRLVNSRRRNAGKPTGRVALTSPSGFLSMVGYPTIGTMVIAGVWHGAGLQFLVFGALHGIFLTINHAWRLLTPPDTRFHKVVPPQIMVGLTFLCVIVTLVFFRAESVSDGFFVVQTMLGLHGMGVAYAQFPYLGEIPTLSVFLLHTSTTLAALAVCFAIVWTLPNTQEILGEQLEQNKRAPSVLLSNVRWRANAAWGVALMLIFCVTILLLDGSERFLYFQF